MKAGHWCALLTQLSLVFLFAQVDRNEAVAQTTLANGRDAANQRQQPKGVACVNDTWVATNLTGAPSPRVSHTAVWTGTEMIVWGGLYNDYVVAYPLDTGARYDPATDTWTATSLDGAPAARFGHTAVWTGTEMIIWGGNGSGNSGARYDPSTDSWTPVSQINAPFPRSFHAAVWTGTEMIVWGGAALEAGRYNPATDTWAIVELPGYEPRYPVAVWTGTEMIAWGGANDSGPLDTGQRYDPANEYWASTSRVNAPSPRKWHTGVWTGSEMIVWGGYAGGIITPPLDTGGRYDPLTNTWAATTIGTRGRYSHTAVWTGTDMIIWGGQGGGGDGSRYRPATDSWVPTSMVQHKAVWTGTEMIVWGGQGVVIDRPFDTGGRYCTYEGGPGRED